MKLSLIFDPKPDRFGLRGDPYFWDYLKDLLGQKDLPCDPDCLERVIRREFFRLSGRHIHMEARVFAPRFAHGGMSSGGLSGSWWLKQGIPLLQSRIEHYNHSCKE